MINARDNPVEWTFLVDEIAEAYEHLGATLRRLKTDSAYGEDEFAVDMSHIAAHLNRAWARRAIARDLTDEEWESFRNFPKDLTPIA